MPTRRRVFRFACVADGVWTRQANRFPTSDIIVVNGEANLPDNWDNPGFFDPAVAENPGKVDWRPSVDSLTMTVGFNTTLSNLGCAGPIASNLYVGVRCNWGQALACRFDISARLLPRTVYHGDTVSAPIAAGDIHYYGLQVGSFDLSRVVIDRVDSDLTYTEAATGVVRTHDFALRGDLTAQRGWCPDPTSKPPPPPPPSPPPPSPPPPEAYSVDASASSSLAAGSSPDDDDSAAGAWFRRVSTPIHNNSASAELELFCTTGDEAGPYAIAVIAAAVQGPIGLAFEAAPGATVSCQNGYVGPQGTPVYESPSALGSLPQCNPSGGGNELKPNRPRYVLRVEHQQFSDEPLASREERPACISYGQWRRYTVSTTGDHAANLFLALSSKVSRVLLRENVPPTLDAYDVGTREDVDALSLQDTSLVASPCDPSRERTWHIAIYLAPHAEAAKRGLARSAFMLSSSLSSARRLLAGAEQDVVLPRSLGGTGSTCCGEMTHFVVAVNSSLRSLRVRVNVTAGALRAVYLKHGACAQFPEDIAGQQCDARTQLCQMQWYERYDRYTGAKRYTIYNTTVVPAGGDFPDKRAAGDWYIGIQDAGVHQRTEFHMVIDQLTLRSSDSDEECDRYGRFDCSHEMWKVPPDLLPSTSAAVAARGGAHALATPLALLLGATCWLLRGRGAGRRRRLHDSLSALRLRGSQLGPRSILP